MTQIDYKAIAAEAAKSKDHNKVNTMATYAPPPAGKTVGRFIEYVELGVQERKAYKGKPKNPAEHVRVVFELLHPKKNIKEIESEGTKKTIADRITMGNMLLSLSDLSGFKQLYDQMKYGRDDIKYMPEMLGEAFVIDIEHNIVNEGKDTERTYANIKAISAPQTEDAMTETVTKLNVPEAVSPVKIFCFDNPTKESWDSLFIDGTRDQTKDGTTTTVSKNYIQETILKAKNYVGSPLEQLLGGIDELPEFSEEADDLGDLDTEVEVEAKPKTKAKKKTKVKPKEEAPTKAETADDALAALDLL